MKRIGILICLLFGVFCLTACSDIMPAADARYKLYPTSNMWNFLKLDTKTGMIWQVQYSIKDKKERFEVPLNTVNIAKAFKKWERVGRYALLPTQNMYNFILLDQLDGETFQVQWSFDENGRFVIPISR